MKAQKVYAVRAGRQVGLYYTWEECKKQVDKFPASQYKSFKTVAEAQAYLGGVCSASTAAALAASTGERGERQSTATQELSGTSSIPFWQNRALAEAKIAAQGREVGAEVEHGGGSAEPTGGEGRWDNEGELKRGGGLAGPAGLGEVASHRCHVWDSPLPDSSTPRNTNTTAANISLTLPAKRHVSVEKLDPSAVYVMEFDGASKGNPGPAGAGALIRTAAGAVVVEVSEGVGRATNNVAEYRGLVCGLREALGLGIRRLKCRGDSQLVCRQVSGRYRVNNEGLRPLYEEAMSLIRQLDEFSISHLDREFNSRADELANIGVLRQDPRTAGGGKASATLGLLRISPASAEPFPKRARASQPIPEPTAASVPLGHRHASGARPNLRFLRWGSPLSLRQRATSGAHSPRLTWQGALRWRTLAHAPQRSETVFRLRPPVAAAAAPPLCVSSSPHLRTARARATAPVPAGSSTVGRWKLPSGVSQVHRNAKVVAMCFQISPTFQSKMV